MRATDRPAETLSLSGAALRECIAPHRIGNDRARVCVVVPEAGSGLNQLALARTLIQAGHDVTTLRLPDGKTDNREFRYSHPRVHLEGPPSLVLSYRIARWLRERRFDVIHFPDRQGVGYYTLLARRQGLAFDSTTICVGVHGPSLWLLETRGGFLDDIDLLECDALERRCVEMADVVWCPDQQLREWLRRRGWASCRGDKFPTCPSCGDKFLTCPSGGDKFPTCPEEGQVKNLSPRTPHRLPLVSVCLVHHNRPRLLRQALHSLGEQDYPNLEVVLVDDGSDDPEATAYLDQLCPLFESRGWRLIRQANRYLGAARNAAARQARGEYLLFMDDDNYARPHEVSTLVRVAERTGADVLTCFADTFAGDAPPTPNQTPRSRRLFAGLDSLANLARNGFGDANALVRRAAFEHVGGFTEDRGVTHEDWEFFARAVRRGCRLEVVPEALFWYRVAPDSMVYTTRPRDNYARGLRPYLENLPAEVHDLLRLAQGQALLIERLKGLTGKGKPLRYRIADTLHRLLAACGFARKGPFR